MKKLILSLVALTLSVSAAHAQWWTGSEKIKGNGNYTSETRTVSNYDRISVQGSMDVELIAGTEGKLQVEAESNLLEYIVTEVEGGRLKISIEKGVNLRTTRDYDIKVTVPYEDIDEVALTGSGDIYGSEVIRAENFKVDVTGSGDIDLKVAARTVQGQVTGSGDIELEGTAEELECLVTGSGDFDASKLKSERVSARVSGSGDITVYASEVLKSRVSGSGDISYVGNPKKQDFKTTGSGTISGN